MNTTYNPYIELIKTTKLQNGDIDHNFLKTFNAIYQLQGDYGIHELATIKNKANKSLVSSIINQNIPPTIKINPDNSFETKISFENFMLEKLIQNLRRIYSNKRNKGSRKQKQTDFDILLSHQKNIYSIFEQLPINEKKQEKMLFKQIFFGNNTICYPDEAKLYITFHEHIHKDNENSHLNIIKKINFNNISTATYKNILKTIIPNNKINFIEKTLNLLPEDNLKDFIKTAPIIIREDYEIRTNLLPLLFIHIIDNNISIDKITKTEFINTILINSSNERWVPILNNFIENNKEKTKDFLSNITLEKIQNKTIQNHPKLLELINTDIKSSASLFVKHLEDNSLSNLKFDLNNQDLLIEINDILSKKYKNEELFKIFISISANYFEKNTLAMILAKSPNLFPLFQPIFMKMKLDETITPTSTQEKIEIKNKYKI